MNLDERPNSVFPNLTDNLYKVQDRSREILSEYLKWTLAPEVVLRFINQIEYATQQTNLTIREIGSGEDRIETALFELECLVRDLAELNAKMTIILDNVRKERIGFCKGNCPFYQRLESQGPTYPESN